VAFENSAPHAAVAEHAALLQVARATFDLLSVAEKEVYEDVSLMELTAFLSWLLSQARGRGCPQEVLVDLTRRTGLWAEVECAWDGLTDDDKGSWVPADARSFLQQTGLGTALGVLGAQQVDEGARDEVGTGSLRHKRCRLRSKMSRPAWAAGAAESRPLLDSATAAVPCASASEAEQHDLGGEAVATPPKLLRRLMRKTSVEEPASPIALARRTSRQRCKVQSWLPLKRPDPLVAQAGADAAAARVDGRPSGEKRSILEMLGAAVAGS